MKRLFEHRAALDSVKGRAFFQASMKLFDQRALSRTHGAHKVEDLAAFFALQRSRVKITNNLRNGLFDAEKLVGEEVVNFYRFVFVNAFGVWIVVYVDISHPGFNEYVIETGMSQLSGARIIFHFIEIPEQISAP